MTRINKKQLYTNLVNSRKVCNDCGIAIDNPARWEKDGYDSLQIGPWSRWQGNLDAKLMVVGQDWGTPTYFKKWKGFDNPKNPTNLNLMDLLKAIGFKIEPFTCKDQIGELFFTNAILCLKQGNLQSEVKDKWFQNCCEKFLKPLIDIIKPQVVVALGEKAFYSILETFSMSYKRQKYGIIVTTVGRAGGIELSNGTRLFPVYHCGTRIINTNTRSKTEQVKDWKQIGQVLKLRTTSRCT